MIAYKLTDQDMRTHQGFQWALGKQVKTDGKGELCSEGWLHFYEHPLLAVLYNCIHADIENPRLFETEVGGKCLKDGQLKVGYTEATLIKELPLPEITPVQQIAYAILCAKVVYKEKSFLRWANDWLSGKDRSIKAADTAYIAANEAACAAAKTAAAASAAKIAANAAVNAAKIVANEAAYAAVKAAANEAAKAVANVVANAAARAAANVAANAAANAAANVMANIAANVAANVAKAVANVTANIAANVAANAATYAVAYATYVAARAADTIEAPLNLLRLAKKAMKY